jgi:hypothetical protein
MIMYVDLLTWALGKDEDGHRSNDVLIADLVHSRARLHEEEGTRTIPLAEALGPGASYDGALRAEPKSTLHPTKPIVDPPRRTARRSLGPRTR